MQSSRWINNIIWFLWFFCFIALLFVYDKWIYPALPQGTLTAFIFSVCALCLDVFITSILVKQAEMLLTRYTRHSKAGFTFKKAAVLSGGVVLVGCVLLLSAYPSLPKDKQMVTPEPGYVSAYYPDYTDLMFNPYYEVGTNAEGELVFANPKQAFRCFSKDYQSTLKAAQRQFGLMPFSKFNWVPYHVYVWQLTTSQEDDLKRREAAFFLETYANSFNDLAIFY